MTSTKALSTNSLKVFFDESGKDTNPNLMAALSIPAPLYNTDPFVRPTQRLRDKTLKLHWKEYTGYHKTKRDLISMIDVVTTYANFLKLNVINYKYTLLKGRKPEFDQAMIQQMIYTKLPERIFYGLLRHYGRETYLETEVFIEKSTEYEAMKLDTKIQELLNVQSLYRNEQFSVTSSSMPEVDFKDYVDLFLSKNASRFFESSPDCMASLI